MIRNLLFRVRDKFADWRGLPMPALIRIMNEDREALRRLMMRRGVSRFSARHVDRMCDWVWRQCPGMDAGQVADMVEGSIHSAASDWRAYLETLVESVKGECDD